LKKVTLKQGVKGKGKRGGARAITHVHITDTTVYLIYIYDKSEQGTISDSELLELVKDL